MNEHLPRESEPAGDVSEDLTALCEELEEREERLAMRRGQLRRARHYFAWKLPILAGVWYLTMIVEMPRWAMFAFVVALTLDYVLAATRVRAAERERDETAVRIALMGEDEGRLDDGIQPLDKPTAQ